MSVGYFISNMRPMSKRQNFCNPETHIGKKPVRVIKRNIAHYLEHVHADFPRAFAALMQRHNLDPFIHIDCSEAAIFERLGGYKLLLFVEEKKRVTIQESFMSLVWCHCCSHMVLFQEQNSKPILNQEECYPADINIEKTKPVLSHAMVFIVCHEFAHIWPAPGKEDGSKVEFCRLERKQNEHEKKSI